MRQEYKQLPIIRRPQNGVSVGFPKILLRQDLVNIRGQGGSVTELYERANVWEAEHGSLGHEKFTLIREIVIGE